MKPRKITVNHYLNKNLIPNENGFKIYVQTIVNRSVSKKCSEIKQRFHDLETLHKVAFAEIEAEKTKITNFVKMQLSANNDFSFNVPKDVLIKRKKSIIKSLEHQLKKHRCELLNLEQYDLFKAKN